LSELAHGLRVSSLISRTIIAIVPELLQYDAASLVSVRAMRTASSSQQAGVAETPVILTGVSFDYAQERNLLRSRNASPQATALEELPRGQRGQSDDEVARALQQRKSESHLRGQPKTLSEYDIGSFLDANGVRNRKGNAADGVNQPFDHQHRAPAKGCTGEL
jgi:hypothetical protein